MAMTYIQQNGSTGAGIKYPSSAHPSATIATSGCGVCSSLMVLLNSTSYSKTLAAWTTEMRNNGCRVAEGTDLAAVCKYMKSKYRFNYEITSDINKLIAHLKKGYKAVANVGNKGYFSSSGHFVTVAGITNTGKLIVLDPYYYTNKWTSTVNGIKRSNYFNYNTSTHEVQCSTSTLSADSRGSKYFLFTPTKKISLKYSSNDVKYNSKTTTTSTSTSRAGSYPTPVTWKNGSTKEITYVDSARKTKTGYLGARENAKCYGKTGTSYSIVYDLDGTSKHKAGFVKYAGGIKTAPTQYKKWKNGSTNEQVYPDTTRKSKAIGTIYPKGTACCLGKIDNMYLVIYNISGTSNYKIGFVKYAGGIK